MPKGVYIRTKYWKLSKQTKKKMSEAHIGVKYPNRKSPKPFSLEHKQRMKESHKGMLGKKHSKETLLKMRESHSGEKAYQWKGIKASYTAKHTWLKNNYGKAIKCENKDCKYPRKNRGRILFKPKLFQWANISGKYLRDRNDYMQLCASCHGYWDNGTITINFLRKKLDEK